MHDPGHFAAIKDRFKVVKVDKGAILFQISMLVDVRYPQFLQLSTMPSVLLML